MEPVGAGQKLRDLVERRREGVVREDAEVELGEPSALLLGVALEAGHAVRERLLLAGDLGDAKARARERRSRRGLPDDLGNPLPRYELDASDPVHGPTIRSGVEQRRDVEIRASVDAGEDPGETALAGRIFPDRQPVTRQE